MVVKNPIIYSCLICAVLFYSGIIKISEKSSFHSLVPESKIVSVSGEIAGSPVKLSSNDLYSVRLKAESVISSDGIKSSAEGIAQVFLPSSIVEALYPGKLFSTSKNTGNFICEPGNVVELNGKFSSKKNNSIFYCSNGKALYWNSSPKGKMNYGRAVCRLQLKRMLYAWGEAGGLLLALLTGSKEYTDKFTADSFRKAGLSHILALSGMHLSIFAGISLFFDKKLKNYKYKIISKPVSIILFVWFAGLSPSLLRAFICSTISFFQQITKVRKYSMINILCASFLIQSCLTPSDIYNTGFILSYSALAGILILSQFFNKILIPFIPLKISSSISASTAAQVFTAPVSLVLFGTFCPFGIIASSIVSPLITIFIYVGLILITINLIFPDLLNISGIFVNFLYTVIKNIVILFSRLPKIQIGD